MSHNAYVVDYAVRRADGTVELGTTAFSAFDIFAAAQKAADMVENYKAEFPDHEVRVWDIGLAADCSPEELFEEDD